MVPPKSVWDPSLVLSSGAIAAKILDCPCYYSETSIHRFRRESEKETTDPGKQ
jgi:hypothetical protein